MPGREVRAVRRPGPKACSIGLLVVLAAGATSSAATFSLAQAASAHAAISDPVGDAAADSRIAISPDLASATVDLGTGTCFSWSRPGLSSAANRSSASIRCRTTTSRRDASEKS